MEPYTVADRLRWLEQNVQGIAHELESLQAQLRALTVRPPRMHRYEQKMVRLLQAQMDLIGKQCDLLREQLGQLQRSDDQN